MFVFFSPSRFIFFFLAQEKYEKLINLFFPSALNHVRILTSFDDASVFGMSEGGVAVALQKNVEMKWMKGDEK